MLRKIKVVYLTVSLIIVFLPVFKFNTKSNSISEIDNRILTENPIGLENITSDNWTSYVNDRIGFRDLAINTNTKLNDKLFGQMVHPTYEYGKNGYVFFKLSNPQYDYDFLDAYTDYIKQIQNYCLERNVPFIYVVDPAKKTIYQQYLPKGYNYNNDRLDYLVKKLKEKEINFVNNTDLLLKKSKNEQVYNKKYDAGHWNDLGAFYGINNIIKKVKEYFPEVNENKKSDFDISTITQTTLPVSQFNINEEVPEYKVKNKINKKIKDNSEEYLSDINMNENYKSFSYIENDYVDNKINALFFQGSYLNSRTAMTHIPFKKCINIHAYENVINFDYYYNIFQPDIVIFESAEYATTSNYYNYDAMTTKKLNAILNEDEAELIDKKVKLVNKNNLTNLTIKMKKVKYAYLKMNGNVYDMIWDDNNKNYYLDIDSNDYNGDYSIYIIK